MVGVALIAGGLVALAYRSRKQRAKEQDDHRDYGGQHPYSTRDGRCKTAAPVPLCSDTAIVIFSDCPLSPGFTAVELQDRVDKLRHMINNDFLLLAGRSSLKEGKGDLQQQMLQVHGCNLSQFDGVRGGQVAVR